MSASASAVFNPGPSRDSLLYRSCELVPTLVKLQRAAELISSSRDLDQLLERVVNDIACSIGNVEVSVWLRDLETGDMVLSGVRGCSLHRKGSRLKIGCQGMVGHVAATGRVRYAPDVRLDPYYLPCEPETRSEVNIPLKAGGEVIGVFSVDNDQTDAFSSEQLHILQTLAGHIASAVENVRLFQLERLANQRIHREEEEAGAIQQALFPKAFPLAHGFAFEAEWRPAGIMAGDWFDFIDLGGTRHGVVLADVSGKGMPAALLMSSTRAALRAIVRLNYSPGETLARLSSTLSDDLPSGKFVTMIYGILDSSSREFTFGSAGHPPPLLMKGEPAFVRVEPGLPLGLGGCLYPEHTVLLEAGDRLLLYTDGVTEAMNADYQEYGPARVIEHFLRPDASVKGLLEEARRHGSGSDLTDDSTALLIRGR
jgi:sigma-B regulation protein RsbU (phosphoserine phosphatase)